jgi:hypothetical protein
MAICPFIGRCKEKVTIDKYMSTCTNITEDAYKKCPTYQQMTAEAKTPEEWRQLLTGIR